MGFPTFAKIFRYGMLAAVALAAAVVAAIALATPASAGSLGGGDGRVEERAWDTDNLKIGSTYTARSFAIPHYGNQGDPARNGVRNGVTENHSPCQPSVMDGFFQNSASQPRNDLPKLEKTAATENKWKETPGHICDSFVTAQNLAISRAASNGGFWLDSDGSLQKGGFGGWMTATRDPAASLGYTTWDNKGSLYSISGYSVPGGGVVYHTRAQAPSATDDGYVARVDAGRTVGVGIPSGVLTLPNPAVRKGSITQNAGVKTFSTEPISHHNGTIHLPQDKSVGGHVGSWCPAKSHPRGEDALIKIGSGTGRTLSSLSVRAKVRLADLFWCRSDVRYPIRYAPQSVAGTTCGTTGAPSCPSGVTIPTGTFRAWGRVNCYYTARSIDSGGNCVYPHPVPQCTDNGSKRDFTTAELGGYTTGAAFTAADDGTTDCADSTPAAPPQQAGFTADACVTASLEIYENRIVGSTAEPGVPDSDRTLAVASGRTAWDLDVTSPHPLTASAPRDATAGSGDPDGCADGSESRADHASSPGDAARSQSPTPSYAASDRTNTAAPPNDTDGDIDYSGATKNLAHRYASRVAENTCAAKLAEAEAELSLLELREDGFAQWLSDYKTAADTNASRYSSYRRTPQQSGSGLAVLRFNDIEANKATYAALLAARYTNLSSALAAAKTAYDATTDRTAGSSRAAVIAGGNSGCAAHYDSEITRLKTLFSSAETSATGSGATGIKEEQNAVIQTRLVSPSAVSVATTVNSYSVPDISAVLARTERSCDGTIAPDGRCMGAVTPPEDCTGPQCGIGNIGFSVTSYYTCPGGSYTVSGTVSGRYKTSTRSSSFSATYAAAARGESTSSSCPNFAVQSGATYASGAAAYVRGTPGTASSLPSVASTAAPDTLRALGKVSLLGSYYLSHGDRANLEASSADDRNAAGSSLSVTAGSVPSGSPQEIAVFQTAYKTAYDTAFSQAEGHMSGTAWNNFDWRYETSTLAWGGYQEDPATTYSASTATPRDGTGCDLVNVASDGTVSVEATRLDYETSSYGKSSVYGARTDAQRTCKIRRTRTPELLLMYAPTVIAGTDTSKTADSRLDADSTASNAEFYYVDYQPTPAAERFKLYGEAEVFAVKASLADSPPVFCASNVPSTVYVSHAAGAMSDMSATIAAGRLYSRISTDVLRPAGYSAGLPTDHCFSGAFANTANVKIAVFDDTAHSAMNLVYLEKDPADTSGIAILASGGALTADPAVAYPGDSAQSSSFYGTTYSMPPSLGSTAGWDVLAGSRDPGDPDPLDTKVKNRIVARDKLASPNLPAVPASQTFKYVSAMGFNIGFLDCRPDVENVVFLGNITNATQDSNQANDYAGITSSSGYPMDALPWYYPAWRDLKENTRGQPRIRTDGSTVAVGQRSGIYTHPQQAKQRSPSQSQPPPP